MKTIFKKELERSLYVHTPLVADESCSVEARAVQKPVLNSVNLWADGSLERWSFDGDGEYMLSDAGTLVLKTWSRADSWPESEVRAVDAANGAYATFGSYVAKLDVSKLDLSRGNRIWFRIKPTCPGLHSPIVRAAFVNNGKIKVPDAYSREGFNAINLKNFEWNTCVWEIDSIAHDKIEEISFTIHRYGKELSSGDDLVFELCDLQFQEVETDVVHGWQCAPETAVFSTTGYWADGVKTAIANTDADSFSILDEKTDKVVFSAAVQPVQGQHGKFSVLDFSEITTEGSYKIHFGDYISASFRIGQNIFEDAVWKLVNFLFCERCGYPVPGKHGSCHGDVVAEHNGLKLAYVGGWHDAADVSQQTVQTAEILHALLEVAGKARDSNTFLYNRILEEANWGLDFILRMRFGDGYRATGAAIRRWTDGVIGNMDDCDVQVHNHSFENFIMAGVQAAAGLMFAESDPQLSWKSIDAAKEDYQFAIRRFEEVGLEEPFMLEHSASASLSQYYAAACWSAAQLVRATGGQQYADFAADFAAKLLACQETGEAKAPMKGYFYRDESKSHIVHFSHQARDQIFIQALVEACKVLPSHPEKPKWEKAMNLFGDYLKELAQYTAPYGMLPAGLYSMKEAEDQETFEVIHPTVDFVRENHHYVKQLQQAISLGGDYYIKCFPVWFSYRGNSAIHLSMGKAASLLGDYFEDKQLIEIAREQVYWTVGKNPFGQSLIYGEGSNYGQQYTALLGETVGEMPVGVQTRYDEDLPYWPQANIATYREIWTTPPGRWLWIIADLMR